MATWIYGLVCPETGLIRYIGQSQDPHARANSHGHVTAARAIVAWHQELSHKGLAPTLVLLERVGDDAEALAAEREWIARYHRFGDLLNSQPGVASPSVTAAGLTRAQAKVREWLAVPGQSQRELARRLSVHLGRGIGQGTVSRIVAGERVPNTEFSVALRDLLGIDPADWLSAA